MPPEGRVKGQYGVGNCMSLSVFTLSCVRNGCGGGLLCSGHEYRLRTLNIHFVFSTILNKVSKARLVGKSPISMVPLFPNEKR